MFNTTRKQDILSMREARYRDCGPEVFLFTKMGFQAKQVTTAEIGSLLFNDLKLTAGIDIKGIIQERITKDTFEVHFSSDKVTQIEGNEMSIVQYYSAELEGSSWRIQSPTARCVRVLVSQLPGTVSKQEINSTLSHICTVINVQPQFYRVWDGVWNGNWAADVMMPIGVGLRNYYFFGKDQVRGLVTYYGQTKQCVVCKKMGHVKGSDICSGVQMSDWQYLTDVLGEEAAVPHQRFVDPKVAELEKQVQEMETEVAEKEYQLKAAEERIREQDACIQNLERQKVPDPPLPPTVIPNSASSSQPVTPRKKDPSAQSSTPREKAPPTLQGPFKPTPVSSKLSEKEEKTKKKRGREAGPSGLTPENKKNKDDSESDIELNLSDSSFDYGVHGMEEDLCSKVSSLSQSPLQPHQQRKSSKTSPSASAIKKSLARNKKRNDQANLENKQ